MTFTEEELELLSPFNAGAHDLAGVEATKEGLIIPAWLCMSAEARMKARIALLVLVKKDMDLPLAHAEIIINERCRDVPMYQRWVERELALKQARAENNPHGFFVRQE